MMTVDAAYIAAAREALSAKGVSFEPGLSDAEFDRMRAPTVFAFRRISDRS